MLNKFQEPVGQWYANASWCPTLEVFTCYCQWSWFSWLLELNNWLHNPHINVFPYGIARSQLQFITMVLNCKEQSEAIGGSSGHQTGQSKAVQISLNSLPNTTTRDIACQVWHLCSRLPFCYKPLLMLKGTLVTPL